MHKYGLLDETDGETGQVEQRATFWGVSKKIAHLKSTIRLLAFGHSGNWCSSSKRAVISEISRPAARFEERGH
jgi:hypothetical protein